MSTVEDASFGHWVEVRRKALRFTRDELAQRVGCAVVTLRKIEGDERRPSEQIAERLAECLRLTAKDRAIFMRAARGTARVDQLSPPASLDATASDGLAATQRQHRYRLPHPLTALIGREAEREALRRLLTPPDSSTGQAARLVTLTGSPGIGKTHLSLQVALDLSPAFRDGACFVHLASIQDSQLVMPTIAQHLNVPKLPGRSALEQLMAYLRDSHLLLVLDNFEQVTPAAVHLAELLAAAPRLSLLVTSRAVLNLSGEQRFAVSPLAVPDMHAPASHTGADDVLAHHAATRLFLERARAMKPDYGPNLADAQAIAQICRRVDGLPLAIELAAARIQVFSPPELLARLGNRLAMLTDGPQNLPKRQRTLRDAIEWSYDLLDADEQYLFRRVGVFVGGWTLEAAEALCAEGEIENAESGNEARSRVRQLMESLINKSLIKQSDAEGNSGETRFMLLETLREYALERLEAMGEADIVRQRHAAFFVALAERSPSAMTSAERRARYVRLDTEQDNVRAALNWSLATHHAELGLRLVGALGGYWFWWANRWDEGWSWISQVLALPEATAPKHARARALRAAVNLLQWRSEHALGNQLADESLTLFRELGDKVGMAWVLADKAWILESRLNSLNEREQLLTESLSLFREIGDQRGISFALWSLAGCKGMKGQSAEAVALLEEGVTAVQAAGDDALAGQLYASLGYQSYMVGNNVRADTLLLQALALCRAGGDADGATNTLINLGAVALAQGNLERASLYLEEGEAWYRRNHHASGLANLLPYLGYLRHLQGDDIASRAVLREALLLQQQRMRISNLIESLEKCAWIAADLHQPQRAARLLGAAEAAHERIGQPFESGEQPHYDRHLARARAELDATAFDAAWSQGRAMSLDQAVAFALDESSSVRLDTG